VPDEELLLFADEESAPAFAEEAVLLQAVADSASRADAKKGSIIFRVFIFNLQCLS
jgi:hypothetical protein